MVVRFVLLVIFYGSCVLGRRYNNEDPITEDDKKLPHNIHWLFAHYHKTGHDLAGHFSQAFLKKGCGASVNRYKQINRNSLLPFISDVLESDITLLAAPELQFPWMESFNLFANHTFRMLHFVRDPYDMIISGFLYHVESPPPPPEVWLVDPEYNACDYNQELVLDGYAVKLGSLRGANGTAIVRSQILSVVELCKSLTSKYAKNTTFNKMLVDAKAVSMIEGVRLEAVRALLYKPGGDVLRMATNAMYEDRRMSKRVFTAQFPIGNKEIFLNTTSAVFDHLMASGDGKLQPNGKVFWECLTKDTAVKKVERAAYVPIAPSVNATVSATTIHITAGHITSDERRALVDMLKADLVLGPLLRVVSEALQVYN